MTPGHDNRPAHSIAAGDEQTGLPALSNWTTVYVLVVIVFVAWVAILYTLTRKFS
jgi:hypothetical protein